jgi:hypothetical protein
MWKLKRYETVLGFGPSFFFGDIGGYSQSKNFLGLRDISVFETRFNVNGNVKYRITQDINVRLSLTAGWLHATDVKGSNEDRRLEASTVFFEPALIGEYYFVKNKAEDSYLFNKGKTNGLFGLLNSLDFYLFTGIGGLGYSVKGNAALESIRPTHGGFTAVVPVGLGATVIYSPYFNFGLELAGRWTFTDNLDGYTSQYSSSNDVYYFLNFTVTYKLKTLKRGPSHER